MKAKKRALSIVLVLLLVISTIPSEIFAAEQNSNTGETIIALNGANASPGDMVTVRAVIQNNPGILGATLKLEYDAGLTLISAESGEAFSSLVMTKPGKLTSPCKFIWDGQEISDGDIQDGEILNLSFQINKDVESGAELAVKLSYVNGDIVNTELNPIDVSISNTVISVSDYIPGDLNNDRKINTTDVILLRRYIAGGYDVSVNEAAADVNGDGKCNTTDVILLRRYIAGGYGVELAPGTNTDKETHTLQRVDYKAATCIEKGNIAYWYCSKCQKYYSDEKGSFEISAKQIIIDLTDHQVVVDEAVPATKDSAGLTEGSHCAVCGKILVKQEEIPKIKGYAIEYNTYGSDDYLKTTGVENPNPDSYISGETIELKNLEKAGYIFEGWYDAPGSTATQIKKIAANDKGNKKLYARWTKITYKVQFDSPLCPVKEVTYTTDEGVTLNEPYLAGYNFLGWSDADSKLYTTIPKGTTGNITLHANWSSKRNQTRPAEKLGKPVIDIDEASHTILMAYEIGTIENVPLYEIEYLGNKTDGVTYTKTVETSKKIEQGTAKNIAETIAEATTRSSSWSLSKDWRETTTKSESHKSEVSSEVFQNASNAWSVSNAMNTTRERGGSTETTNSQNISGKVNKDFKGSITGELSTIPLEGETLGGKLTASLEAGISKEVKHETTNTQKNQTYWNTNTGYSKAAQMSGSRSVSESLGQKISDSVDYSVSNTVGCMQSQTEGMQTSETKSREYASAFTYSTEDTVTTTMQYSNAGAPAGYYRVVCAGTLHVFAVVTYDMATRSYGVYTYSVAEDNVRNFIDYSKNTSLFNDYENGVLPFEVPYEVNEYVDNIVGATSGLEVDIDSGKIVGYSGTDNVVVIPQYLPVDNGDGSTTVVKVTGIESGAFAGKDIAGIRLSDNITEIPENAFKNCDELEIIEANSIEKIGNNAFSGCTVLKEYNVSSSVKELGKNAFAGVKKVTVKASDGAVAKAAVTSGAKNITLDISKTGEQLYNTKLEIPSGTEVFELNGGVKDYINLRVVSDAEKTKINGMNFKGNTAAGLKSSSSAIELNRVTVESSEWAMMLLADNTELSLFGTVQLNSTNENAVLCKNVTLKRATPSVVGKLNVTGNIQIYGSFSQNSMMTQKKGNIINITSEQYEKLWNNTWGEWSEWSESKAENSFDTEVETKVQYRYADKQTTTSTNSSMNGWTRTGSTTQYGSYGGWSAWQREAVGGSDTRQVETNTIYGYYYFRCPNCGAHMHVYTSCYKWAGGCGASNMTIGNGIVMFSTTPWSSAGLYEFHGTGRYATDSLGGGRWFKWVDSSVPCTGYRYRDRSKTVVYSYYKWGNWSEWNDTVYNSGDNRKVETRTMYRYRTRQ